MPKENNYKIIDKIIDDMILEIEVLSSQRETLASNIKLIKEITMVLKELDKLFEDESKNHSQKSQRDEFFDKLLEQSAIPTKKEYNNAKH